MGETYARCGFDYDPTMSTVQMLTQIESKLERCLAVADEMPAAYVRESHWSGKTLEPQQDGAPPILSFLGSQRFGCVQPVPQTE